MSADERPPAQHLEGRGRARSAPASRRGLALSFVLPTLLALAGCGDECATVRYKVTATVAVAGRLYEGSVVRETRFTSTPNSLTGFAAAVKDVGEALVVDPGEGRSAVFVLLNDREGSKEFPFIVLRCFGIKSASDPEWPAALRSIPLGKKCTLSAGGLDRIMPLVVAFRDEMDPKSIFEVTPASYRDAFGVDARFVELTLERADEGTSLDDGIDRRLPWLNRIPFDGHTRVLGPYDASKLAAAQATLANRVTDRYFRD